MIKTKFLKNLKVKDEFFSIKNKIFSVSSLELHEQSLKRRNILYERYYFNVTPLVKLSGKYNESYSGAICLVLSVDKCADSSAVKNSPRIGETTYNILFNNEKLTILDYHVEKVLNGI